MKTTGNFSWGKAIALMTHEGSGLRNSERDLKKICKGARFGSGMAIARRMSYGIKIVIGDKSIKNAETISKIMNDAGFDTEVVEMDLSSRNSIRNIIEKAQSFGEISMLVNAAGVSLSQAPIAPGGEYQRYASCLPAGKTLFSPAETAQELAV